MKRNISITVDDQVIDGVDELTKHLGVRLSGQDVLVNVVGGLRIAEPAADLGIALATVSSLSEVPVKPGCVAIGAQHLEACFLK